MASETKTAANGESLDVIESSGSKIATRRTFLKGAAVAGAVAAMYTVPKFTSIHAGPAYATTRAPFSCKLDKRYIYGHDNVNHNIIKIDLDLAVTTIVGGTGLGSGMSGLATAGLEITGPTGAKFPACATFGLLRLGSSFSFKDWIVTVNTSTGAATQVVQTSRLIGGRGIAFGPDGTTLYVIEGGSSTVDAKLSTISIADGTVTFVGNTGVKSSGLVSLEIDPSSGKFMSLLGDKLYSILPATGAATLVGTMGSAPSGFSACTIARSPNGTWYTVNTNTGKVHSVDIATPDLEAAILDVNDTSGVSSQICGAAFAPTP